MIRSTIAILLFSTITFGQQPSLPPQRIIPQSVPGTVTLTLAEYNRLVEVAARKPKPLETAPQPFVLSRAVFKLRIENQAVVGSLDIEGDVLQKGPAKVPLVAGLTITEARPSPRPLPLLRDGASLSAVVTGPGPFSLSLNVAAPLGMDAGRASLTLPVPAAGSSLMSLDIPGTHADVRIEPGLITTRTSDAAHTTIEATLEPGKQTRIWWTTREAATPAAPREVRFLSDIKSVLTVGDSQIRIATLCDVTVTQGDVAELKLPVPAGFEFIEATGTTLESSEAKSGELLLKLREPSRRAHQFLVVFERASADNKLDAPLLSIAGAQRETGELLIEGVGTMDLIATETGGLRRIDVREAGAISRSLARFPLQAAFRYHRRAGDTLKLALEWNQYPDGAVLSAEAERATTTTLLNVEGKLLTEVSLRLRNHAQAFVKVDLPRGATLLSAEVEGEKVKPVQGTDGSRVPLLRAGFRPSGPYTVSFVYLSAGAPFAKSGSYELSLPKLDVPISLVTWEVFLPDRFQVKQFGGNALSASFLPSGAADPQSNYVDDYSAEYGRAWVENRVDIAGLEAGQIGGIVVDPTGAVVPGAVVKVINNQTGAAQSAVTDSEGHWVVSGVAPGAIRVRVERQGFSPIDQAVSFDANHSLRLGTTLQAGNVSETVNVTASSAEIERDSLKLEARSRKFLEDKQTAPSQNVANLQRRVAGVLPIQVDVPRAGKSYRFVRPLVLEEETKITFQYKSR
jgi:hypothetical protein